MYTSDKQTSNIVGLDFFKFLFYASYAVKRAEKYFSKNPRFNAVVHALGGLGVGVLLTNVAFNPHPVRWAALFILLALLGHWYAYRKG